jgi:parallel beta-helix repeat protein
MWLENSDGNSINNNTLTNNEYGVELYYSESNLLRDNNMTDNRYNFGVEGHLVSHFIQDIDISNTVNEKPIYYWVNQHDRQFPANAGYIAAVNSTNITVANLSISNNVQGILFAYTANSTIEGNNVTKSQDGVGLYYSDHNTIVLNSMTESFNGMDIRASNNNTIGNNTVWGNTFGIYAYYSDNNAILSNSVTESYEDGIGLYYSDHNMIAVNSVSDTLFGIDICASDSNTVNGNSVSEYAVGIYPYYSNNDIVINNKVSGWNSLAGIALTGAKYNIICGNEVAHNTFLIGAGIYLEWSSDNNTIVQNKVSNNIYGVSIGYWGQYGLRDQDDNNMIYHNNLIGNTEQALGLNSLNAWDDGYPSGGNYWSDYEGTDLFGGPYQNFTRSDGIGDTPYPVDADNIDRFPYMIEIRGPYINGDLNHDGKVDIKDVATAAAAFGSYPGHPRWNSAADVNQDGKIDIKDISLIAKNFGKSWT